MAEITQKQGTWHFDGEVLRVVPGSGRRIHPLRTSLGELAIPLAAIHGVAFEQGKKRGRLRLRTRAGADPIVQSSGDELPAVADPYSLEVENDRGGVAEYLADAVRDALTIEQVPVDTPTDRYLMPGPTVPAVLNGSDGTMTFDGERLRTVWGTAAESAKKSAGTRTLSLDELRGVEWTRPTWSSGWLRLVPQGSQPVIQPSHDPNCVVLWGFRETRETAQAALLAAAVTARLPHPYATAGPAPEPTSGAPALEKAAGTTETAPAPDEDPDALLRRLRELGELRASGVLTDEEFDRAKQSLLRRL